MISEITKTKAEDQTCMNSVCPNNYNERTFVPEMSIQHCTISFRLLDFDK